MKNRVLKYIFAGVILLSATAAASAQNMRTGYFMDGYAYKFKMNPAMGSSRGFFALPVLGNFNLGLESNLGLSSVLYPKQDGSGLTTFLNSEIDTRTALGKFDTQNRIGADTDLSLIAFGFWGKKAKMFHTVDLSLNADVAATIPYDLFRFAKEGTVNGNVFDLGDTGVKIGSHLSLAYGFSLPIGKYVRFGARAKFLMGIASAEASLKGTKIVAGTDSWYVETDGSIKGGLPLKMYLPKDKQGYVDWKSISETFSTDSDAISAACRNYGGAVDLGVTVDFLENFTASASVTDLGFILWNNWSSASAAKDDDGNLKRTYVVQSGEETDFSKLGDKFLDCLDFDVTENKAEKALMLDPTVYVGLEYRMPFYRRMTIGLLSTTKIAGAYSWTEGRFSLNINPADWFSVATNYAYSTFGHSAGFAFTFHLPGFNLFMGTDSFLPLTEVSPQLIPVKKMTTSLTYGINIMFGKYHGKYAAESAGSTK